MCKYVNYQSWDLLARAVLVATGRLYFNNQSNPAPLVPCTQYLYKACFSEAILQYFPQQCLLLMASSGKLQTKRLWLEQRILPVRFVAVKWCGINILSEGVFQSDFVFFFSKKITLICWGCAGFENVWWRVRLSCCAIFYSYCTCWDSSCNYNTNTLPASKCKVF